MGQQILGRQTLECQILNGRQVLEEHRALEEHWVLERRQGQDGKKAQDRRSVIEDMNGIIERKFQLRSRLSFGCLLLS